jgi:hypothetical protein
MSLGRYDYDCGYCGRRIHDKIDIDEWHAQHAPDCPILICLRAEAIASGQ